jgi:hypothetical protein
MPWTRALDHIDGQVVWPRSTRLAVQATYADVAAAATVSLMEITLQGTGASQVAVSTTVATTVTNATGGFTLNIPGFKPKDTATYIFEAVKGLGSNSVNKDAVRLRTYLKPQSGGWLSMTSLNPTKPVVYISEGTTAIAIMYGLRPNNVDPMGYMGAINAGIADNSIQPTSSDTYTVPATGTGWATLNEFHKTSDLVRRAVEGDTDPITAVQFSTGGSFFVKTNQDPFIETLSSYAAGFGAPILVRGLRFDAMATKNTVYFGGETGIAATIDTSKPNSTAELYVTVPTNAVTGEVLVRNAYGLSNPITFTVIPQVNGSLVN